MKILKNNKDVEVVTPTMTVVCKSGGFGDDYCCNSLLEVAAEDIKCGHYHIDDENVNIYHYITCPVCMARVEVNYRDIPVEIRKLM